MNEDESPIEHGDFPAYHVTFQGCQFQPIQTTPPSVSLEVEGAIAAFQGWLSFLLGQRCSAGKPP